MAYLRCDECGASTDHQGSWDTPIKILCIECSKKAKNTNNTTEIIHENKYYYLNQESWHI